MLARGEDFLRTFSPSARHGAGITVSQLEREATVAMAFDQIDRLNARTNVGADAAIGVSAITDAEIGTLINTHRETIRDYVQDQGEIAASIARSGRISDMSNLARRLEGLIAVAREDSIDGRETSATAAQAKIVMLTDTFMDAFSRTCGSQSYSLQTVLGLERQSELLGMEHDLKRCLNKRLSATIGSAGVTYLFESCVLTSATDWKVTLFGRVTGQGDAGGGFNKVQQAAATPIMGGWQADDLSFNGYNQSGFGDFQVIVREAPPAPPPPPPPERVYRSSLERSNDCAVEHKPEPPMPRLLGGDDVYIRFKPIVLTGTRGYAGDNTQNVWAQGPVVASPELCPEDGGN